MTDADGKSNKEIAGALGISERTVKTHLGSPFRETRSHEPNGSGEGRHAARAGTDGLIAQNLSDG
ncbi:MAG TPA: helix-turn-helix transcriptional regulator [Thermoanaerobaculia bacterium]